LGQISNIQQDFQIWNKNVKKEEKYIEGNHVSDLLVR